MTECRKEPVSISHLLPSTLCQSRVQCSAPGLNWGRQISRGWRHPRGLHRLKDSLLTWHVGLSPIILFLCYGIHCLRVWYYLVQISKLYFLINYFFFLINHFFYLLLLRIIWFSVTEQFSRTCAVITHVKLIFYRIKKVMGWKLTEAPIICFQSRIINK